MKKKLTDNLGLKVLAILFSVVLWMIVMNIDDPVKSKPFKDIPVKIVNAEAITKEGKVYEVLEDTDTIDVTVYAKGSILSSITRDNIVATADMKELTFMNTVRIQVTTNENGDKLEDIRYSTENMKLSVEELKRVQKVIETRTVGQPGDGYLLGDVSSDQNLVRLSGPESLISQVDKAVVEVNVEGISSSIQADYPLKLYDAEGKEIDNDNIVKSIANIRVTANILQEKAVPIRAGIAGKPAEGYAATGEAVCNPEYVMIAGKSSILKNINEIVIPEGILNIDGLNTDAQALVDIADYLPDNVNLAEEDFNGKVSVTVDIQKKERTELTLDKTKITIQNMPTGFKGSITDMEEPLTIGISGLPNDMSTMANRTLSGYINVEKVLTDMGKTEMTPGNYHAEVVLNLPDGVTADAAVTVTLTVEEEE